MRVKTFGTSRPIRADVRFVGMRVAGNRRMLRFIPSTSADPICGDEGCWEQAHAENNWIEGEFFMSEIKRHVQEAWGSGNLARATILFWFFCVLILPIGVIIKWVI